MEAMGKALMRELDWKMIAAKGPVSTVYFGGGTPSLFDLGQLESLVSRCLAAGAHPSEITLEANPEDITDERLKAWLAMGITRLSIGVQTFDDERLQWMNRAHSSQQAVDAVLSAHALGFQHLSADLIYGLPDRKMPFAHDLEKACGLPVDHLSAYILTVEDQTALGRNVQKGLEHVASESLVEAEYAMLCSSAKDAGFEHYELSSFARSEGYAQHNQHYWTGLPFLGIGPGAHGFDGQQRLANVSNNPRYIAALQKAQRLDDLPVERDVLSAHDRYNEGLMTGLRTAKGIDVEALENEYGHHPQTEDPDFWRQCIADRTLEPLGGSRYRIREEKWLVADRIASAFFIVE